MSRKFKFRNPEGIYFITSSVVGWVDVFTRDEYREILLDSFKYCQINKGLKIYAYVIMSNHFHMIVSKSEKIPLENIMRDLKKFTSGNLIKAIKSSFVESRKEWMLKLFEEAGIKNSNNTKYQFWQQDNHPIELDNNKIMEQTLSYIHENPVRQGFCNEAECYNWSSAIDYAGGKGIINIDLLE